MGKALLLTVGTGKRAQEHVGRRRVHAGRDIEDRARNRHGGEPSDDVHAPDAVEAADEHARPRAVVAVVPVDAGLAPVPVDAGVAPVPVDAVLAPVEPGLLFWYSW